MRNKSIRLSEKHGLNPSITHCECCGKETGIALLGHLKGDAEAPRDIYQGLCDDCQKVVSQQGLIVIEVRDGESGSNPYRTGRIIGISKETKERMFKDIKSHACYMQQSMFQSIFGEHYA